MTKSGERFAAIYALAKEIPSGKVASYGMLASLIPGVTARIAGYAMAGTPEGENIPWHRVINSAGKISERDGAARQRARLEAEGVTFSNAGKLKWQDFGWEGPSQNWLDANGLDPIDFMTIRAGWPR